VKNIANEINHEPKNFIRLAVSGNKHVQENMAVEVPNMVMPAFIGESQGIQDFFFPISDRFPCIPDTCF
jgi:hypothetical protein